MSWFAAGPRHRKRGGGRKQGLSEHAFGMSLPQFVAPRPIGRVELSGLGSLAPEIAGAPDAGAARSRMGGQHLQPRGERRGGVADKDHERAAADRGAVDSLGGDAEILHNRCRRLAGGRDPAQRSADHRLTQIRRLRGCPNRRICSNATT
jgi:hypothetical protein